MTTQVSNKKLSRNAHQAPPKEMRTVANTPDYIPA